MQITTLSLDVSSDTHSRVCQVSGIVVSASGEFKKINSTMCDTPFRFWMSYSLVAPLLSSFFEFFYSIPIFLKFDRFQINFNIRRTYITFKIKTRCSSHFKFQKDFRISKSSPASHNEYYNFNSVLLLIG